MADNKSSSGISTLSLLGVAFVTLKLLGKIDWSWWYVTMPFWIGFPIVCIFLFIAFIIEIRRESVRKFERERRLRNHQGKSRFQARLDDYMADQHSKLKS